MRCKQIIIIGLLLLIPFGTWATEVNIVLDVIVDTETKKLTGTARLSTTEPVKTTLDLGNIQSLWVDQAAVAPTGDTLILKVAPGDERVLDFETIVTSGGSNHIDSDNVFLTGNWFPKSRDLATYTLEVALPKGFLAVSEADAVTVRNNGHTEIHRFTFGHPVDGLSLAASRDYVRKQDRYNQIAIEAYFFKEDAHLADDYMSFTKKYLAMYEKMLTPYPYRRFVVAENIFPTGYSMPTYTLLGRTVVRLPFITRTSLGHEILHQWFGNSVYIDYASGNWAEGITNYLADHHYADLKGDGATYRKQMLVNYRAYVGKETSMALADFYSRRNRAESAVGYGKSAMIFHELRQLVGEERFFDSCREFLNDHRFKSASWSDIQKAFEKITQSDWSAFFLQRLKRKDIPDLTIDEPTLVVEQGKLLAKFDIIQAGDPYHLQVPVSVRSGSEESVHSITVSQAREPVRIVLDEPPTHIVIDENYDVMRALAPSEAPAVLANIMGKQKVLVVMAPGHALRFQPIINALAINDMVTATPQEVTFEQVKNHSVIFCGYGIPVVNMLFGRQPAYDDGVRLQIEAHPYNQNEAVMLLHVKNEAEGLAVRRKLPHYGKYSKLVFDEGKLRYKEESETGVGIPVIARPPTQAINPDKTSTLNNILPGLKKKRVVYIGEQHEKYAHHFNQLLVIQKLHEAGIKIAVGMEMFQLPYQAALDDFLSGRIDERRFLIASAYYEKWRFDYNLYKPIIDFLKKEQIPLIALNIEGDISRKTARKGLEGLAADEKQSLPPEMDFSDNDYRQDLFQVFGFHDSQHQLKDFDYFLQAQVLWDETMAESVHRYIANHPDTTMVVLAGNGHLRYKYGIPNRVFRRNGLPFTVIVQDETTTPGIADFVLKTTPLKGTKAPLLGVSIETKDNAVHIVSVLEKSPAGKSGLEKGDIIRKLNGQKIESLTDLKFALFYTSMGSTVSIEVERKGNKVKKQVTLFDFKHSATAKRPMGK